MNPPIRECTHWSEYRLPQRLPKTVNNSRKETHPQPATPLPEPVKRSPDFLSFLFAASSKIADFPNQNAAFTTCDLVA